MSSHDHLLFSQLLGNILGTAAGHINPGLGEKCARSQHEENVEESVDGIGQDGGEGLRRGEIVAQTTDGVGTSASSIVPHAQQWDKEVSGEFDWQHLGDHVQIAHQSRLKKNIFNTFA